MLARVSEQIAECLRHAAEFHDRAEQEADGESRVFLLNMEGRWLALARSYEFELRLADFTAEAGRQLARSRLRPALTRVTCPECGKFMRLTTVEPLMPPRQADIARFDCVCGFTYKHTIKRSG
jgi:hypothetical protein